MIRGELAIRRGTSRHTLVSGGSIRIQTMMQSCASAAKLRDRRPCLVVGTIQIGALGPILARSILPHGCPWQNWIPAFERQKKSNKVRQRDGPRPAPG